MRAMIALFTYLLAETNASVSPIDYVLGTFRKSVVEIIDEHLA